MSHRERAQSPKSAELASFEEQAIREQRRRERESNAMKEDIRRFEENLALRGMTSPPSDSAQLKAIPTREDRKTFESRLESSYRSDLLSSEVAEFVREMRERVTGSKKARLEQLRRQAEGPMPGSGSTDAHDLITQEEEEKTLSADSHDKGMQEMKSKP